MLIPYIILAKSNVIILTKRLSQIGLNPSYVYLFLFESSLKIENENKKQTPQNNVNWMLLCPWFPIKMSSDLRWPNIVFKSLCLILHNF